MLKLESALWTFLDNPTVLPTNNEAERLLRALVFKRKIAGPIRSERGDGFITRGFTAYETCRRQGGDLVDYLYGAVVAWIGWPAVPSG